jgi:hypothetical protein
MKSLSKEAYFRGEIKIQESQKRNISVNHFDFPRTILILSSNLRLAVPSDASFGFLNQNLLQKFVVLMLKHMPPVSIFFM